ncbi:MAG TPA: apolipoprotein N-acyltransferase [Candidatus Baltobacteraceae bacterium]|nr:apolipoprotein N-acyltransferase [Candidatus Baltobacteraceae bacterium]
MPKPVTCLPHPDRTIIAATTTAIATRRTFLSFATARAAVAALACAFALHLAFPPAGWWWLAPFAFAGLFASWWSVAPRSGGLLGYASGLAFFVVGFSYFGNTAGSLVGPFAPLLDLGPAAVESVAFAFAALATSLAARRCDPRVVPLVAAAAFTLAEQLRSTGVLGVPCEQIGIAMIDSPLRALAAYGGGYALTFVTALLGASLAWWLTRMRDRARLATALVAWTAVAACALAAWIAWPARHYAPPHERVAAVQGGIEQSLKRSAHGLTVALTTYDMMTRALRAQHPAIVLWPETVITADLKDEPALRARFATLADSLRTTLYAGGFWDDGTRLENALLIFDGRLGTADVRGLYVKEALVPFAEWLPGPAWLRALPLASNIGPFAPGHNDIETVYGATPLICWESLFGDIAHARLAEGTTLFLVATDDAWFGRTEFPYEHAMAASLRAVETGRWVLQAAATGISGIVAPDGTWTKRSALGGRALVVGDVGPPAPALYARLGPGPVGWALALAVVLPFVRVRRRRP